MARFGATSTAQEVFGNVVQRLYTSDNVGRQLSAATNVPTDDTTPQMDGTELVQYTQLDTAITPDNASNIIEVEGIISGFNATGTAASWAWGVAEAGSNNALTVSSIYMPANNVGMPIPFFHRQVAGVTSELTFEVGLGRIASNGQIDVNWFTVARFNGTYVSWMKVTEYTP